MVEPLDDKDVFSNIPSKEELEDAMHKFKYMILFAEDDKAHLQTCLEAMKRVYKRHYGEVLE